MAALRKDHLPICIEKLRIALRTLAATEGEPMILRRAKVFANVLREIPIFIEEDTLIAGNGASKPMGLEIDPEYFIWSQDEIDALKRLHCFHEEILSLESFERDGLIDQLYASVYDVERKAGEEWLVTSDDAGQYVIRSSSISTRNSYPWSV